MTIETLEAAEALNVLIASTKASRDYVERFVSPALIEAETTDVLGCFERLREALDGLRASMP